MFYFLSDRPQQKVLRTTSKKILKAKKRKLSEDHWGVFQDACKVVKNQTPSSILDADLTFGQFVGLKLKTMTEARKNICIAEIIQILTKATSSSDEPFPLQETTQNHEFVKSSSVATPATPGSVAKRFMVSPQLFAVPKPTNISIDPSSKLQIFPVFSKGSKIVTIPYL